MYLKRIEIQGFKSFANKIVFDFHNGITAIVGPNGSGKSNVSDAVRWVLGEQSARQLRGGSMSDVIFAGTELRKAQGYAYVNITFDNADKALNLDFDEVSVSRRIYRSGESEYMINHSPCRLKDVQEIFFDTGIGKDGYSIIGQGQVDKILNGRPEDRRELFDEAAGITKYKRRKAIAVKKLENERVNLTRISDIISELEKQVGPLERQSKVARQFLDLREELKSLDISYFIAENSRIAEERKQIVENEAIYNADMENARALSDDISFRFSTIETNLNALNEKLEETRKSVTSDSLEVKELQGGIDLLHEQIHFADANIENHTYRMSGIDSDIEGKRREIREITKTDLEVDGKLDEYRKGLSEIQDTLEGLNAEIAVSQKQWELQKSDEMNAISRRSELKAKEQKYLTLIEQTQIRQSEIAQKIIRNQTEKMSLDEKYRESDIDFRRIIEEIRTTDKKLEEKDKEKQNLRNEIANLENRIIETRNNLQKARAKYDTLKNISERYEGYSNAIRKVMERKDGGIHGVIADLITVKKGFETALETALGSRIQHIVTENENDAKKMIQYLKQNKYGRATFLPLSEIRSNEHHSFGKVLTEQGVIGIASDLVECEPVYKPLIRSMLSRQLVVDTIDHAIALERAYNHELRIVTIDGELLSPGGAISGGAYKNTGNLLGRKREIEDLETEIGKIKQTFEGFLAKQNVCKTNVEEISAIQAKERAIMQDLSLKRNSLELNLRNIKEQLASNEEMSDSLKQERSELEENKQSLLREKQIISTEMASLENTERNSGNSSVSLFGIIEELKRKREDFREEKTRLEMQIFSLEQKKEFASENSARLQKEIESLQTERLELSDKLMKNKEDIVQKNAKISEEQERIRNIQARIAVKESEIQELQQNSKSLSQSSNQLFEEKERAAKQIASLDREIFRMATGREKLEEKQADLSNYMWTEYELTLETAKEVGVLSDAKQSDLKKNIEHVKTEIRKLGDVNVNAIEEYREVSERYNLLKSQHDDIIIAETRLEKIIEDLDSGMRIQFEEKFARIKTEFDAVFKELFGGGTGKLALEEDADILEANVSVISQPPGKKLQNMMQLSGGEKALTAIALLFAIQNLKPSPFALLDEIEAALDDSNVDRFAKYLHKLTDRTQFIVITHRRGTMVSADRLYGITMQEKGVSTLVSVSLVEDTLK